MHNSSYIFNIVHFVVVQSPPFSKGGGYKFIIFFLLLLFVLVLKFVSFTVITDTIQFSRLGSWLSEDMICHMKKGSLEQVVNEYI